MAIFTLSPDRPFADVLAAELLARTDGDPEKLAEIRLLLPSRRAIRALQEAFLRASQGKPLLLPVMQAIGDVGEEELLLTSSPALDIPPAVAPARRILLLADLVLTFQKSQFGPNTPFEQAIHLATELADFLDDMQRQELQTDHLPALVTGELAKHWELTVEFLQILIRHWPEILAEQGRIDPIDHRNRLLDWQAQAWQRHPPATPVIIAGTTGSMPATARLMQVVHGLPQGMVILPGLDTTMADADWQALDETHPQWGMAQLLAGFGLSREDVAEFAGTQMQSPRIGLLQAALRPALQTDQWQATRLPWEEALEGFVRLDCATTQQEATAIALILRDALETPGKTAAVITPNRELARRVASVLRRFHIEIDDSGGTPLSKVPGGVFLQLVGDAVLSQAAPVELLALLKHPFAQWGMAAGQARRLARLLEKKVLRGVRIAQGLEGIVAVIRQDNHIKEQEKLISFVERIAKILLPLTELLTKKEALLPDLLAAQVQVAEAIACDGEGRVLLWEREDGEALVAFLHEVVAGAQGLKPVQPRFYPSILRALLQGRAWRPRYGTHPRLHILSPQEARLQQFDRVVLAGLNEGGWPEAAQADPWMSRPMRRDFGLPSPEERIGLSAHDFYSLAGAKNVFLTRAEKEGGAVSVPSRWLLRLEAMLGILGGEEAKRRWRAPGLLWCHWAAALDKADGAEPMPAPTPTPPAEARKKAVFVTKVEMLLGNPYGFYAEQILRLRKLDPIDMEPDAAEFGNQIHAIFERYLLSGHKGLEPLLAIGREALQPLLLRPAIEALWWPRFEQIAQWFIEKEAELQPDILRSEAESERRVAWEDFTLTSRMDRIDLLRDGSTRLIDYKTGKAFRNNSEMERGLKCQLLLGGAILMAAGATLADLQYWQVKGSKNASEIISLREFSEERMSLPLEDWVQDVFARVQEVLAYYAQADSAFLYCPVEEDAPGYNPYVHLARVQEWGGI